MLSTAIITLIMLILISITGQTSATWRYTTGKIEQFQESRAAFEAMTTRISQATLNTYWDYDSPTLPTRYERRSELRFITGQAGSLLGTGPNSSTRITHCVFFHAPLGFVDDTQATGVNYHGLENLMNVWGYYVELNSDKDNRPAFLSSSSSPPPLRYRFRLMQFMQPSEKMMTYGFTSGYGTGGKAASQTYFGTDWFKASVNGNPTFNHPIAENVVALIITPRLSKNDEAAFNKTYGGSSTPDVSPLSPLYAFDSTKTKNDGVSVSAVDALKQINPKDQLPPVIQVTMVAIDEVSAGRLSLTTSSADIFKLSGKFTDTSKYSADLLLNPGAANDASLENAIIAKKANYRIFTTNVPIRAAKWSREQAN
jgi:uncharacterized protein (TIGR02599 family)